MGLRFFGDLRFGIFPQRRFSVDYSRLTLGKLSGMRTHPLTAFSFLLLSTSIGCSTFNRDWNAAGSTPAGPADITGRWLGSWRSSADDHTGQLKCVITRQGPDRYRAHFAATYWKIFHFDYSTDLNGSPAVNGQVPLEGKENLGWLAGGVYNYSGHATADNFYCNYKSKYDFGVFQMKRPQ